MRNISKTSGRENQNTHCMLNNIFFRKSFHLCDNLESTVEPEEPQTPIWCTPIACW